MSDWPLERAARHPLRDDPDGWGDANSPPTEAEIELSKAISLKRIADAFDGQSERGSVLYWLDQIASVAVNR